MRNPNTSQVSSKLPLTPIVLVPAGELLFVSGQVAEQALLSADVRSQMVSICNTVRAVLATEGRTLKHVVRVGLFLTDMGDFATVNDVYRDFFRNRIQLARPLP
jgi:enamine deaminase RidA (YjgF/YER057c/UK114 family)